MEQDPIVCKFYKSGACKYGESCKNLHPGLRTQGLTLIEERRRQRNGEEITLENDAASSASASVRSTSPTSKTNNNNNNNNNKEKDKDKKKKIDVAELVDEKKASMRTSIDVAQRILWDPDLNSHEFAIGYLDRFLGVIEKPFSAFSWEDPAAVDLFTLAIPKHRIEYYKYRDVMVWNKSSRLDDFFGSVGGRKINEVIEQWKAEHRGDDDNADNTNNAEEEDNYHQPTTNSSSWAACTDVAAAGISNVRIASKDARPNLFLCIRITNEDIVKSAVQVQESVCGMNAALRRGLIAPSALHITLAMLRVPEPKIRDACTVIERQMGDVLSALVPATYAMRFHGVRCFRSKVVYASMDESTQDRVRLLSMAIRSRLRSAGIEVLDPDSQFVPHVTLVKINKETATGGSTDVATSAYRSFSQLKFGSQRLDSIHLCRVGSLKEAQLATTGFYEVLAFASNPWRDTRVVQLLFTAASMLRDASSNTTVELDQACALLEQGSIESILNAAEILRKIIWTGKASWVDRALCIVARGLPGSGKSTIASALVREACSNGATAAICSADDFMVNNGGAYVFNPQRLVEVHNKCQEKFVRCLTTGTGLVVVDNTHVEVAHYKPLLELAALLGWSTRVFEIRCGDINTAALYSERGSHHVPFESTVKMMMKWESDSSSLVIEPATGEEQEQQSPVPPDLVECLLYCPRLAHLKKPAYSECVYSGAFLDQFSRTSLLRAVPPMHSTELGGTLHADHVTLKHRGDNGFRSTLPSSVIYSTPVGAKVELEVTSVAHDRMVHCVAVTMTPRVATFDQGKYPHITLSTAPGTMAYESNRLLSSGAAYAWNGPRLSLAATVGIVVKLRSGILVRIMDSAEANLLGYKCGDGSVTCSSASNSTAASSAAAMNQDDADLQVDESIRRLYIFDFDMTLMDTPSYKEGIPAWCKQNGKKEWPYGRSWISRPESLTVKGLLRPGRALCEWFKVATNADDVRTAVVTGRHDEIEKQVSQCLSSAGVFPDYLCIRPGPLDTNVHKANTLSRFLRQFPKAKVTIWEDSADSIKTYKEVAMEFPSAAVDIIDVATLAPVPFVGDSSKTGRVCCAALKCRGRDAQDASLLQVEARAMEAVADAWNAVVTPEAAVLNFPYGSRKLGRVGDLDVMLVMPDSMPVDQACANMEKVLRTEKNADRVYIAPDARVPRIRARLLVPTPESSKVRDHVTVEMDCCIACVPRALFDQWLAQQREQPWCSDDERLQLLLTLLEPKKSSLLPSCTMALDGPLVLAQMETRIYSAGVEINEFGLVLDVIAQSLAVRGLKTNSLHCLRTFHIAEAIARVLERAPRSQIMANPTADSLLPLVIQGLASGVTDDEWRSIVGMWVPHQFLSLAVQQFKEWSHHPAFSGAASSVLRHAALDYLLCTGEEAVPFPPPKHTEISIQCAAASNRVSAWAVIASLEARIPKVIRTLLDRSLPLVPGPLRNDHEVARFAVANSWANGTEEIQGEFAKIWPLIVCGDAGVQVSMIVGHDTHVVCEKQ